MVVLAEPLCATLFQYHKFTAADTRMVAAAVSAMSVGIPAFMLSKVLLPAFYARQDTRTPMIIAICGYWIGGYGTAIYLGFWTPLAGVGVWIGLAVGLVLVAGLLLIRWRMRERLGLLPA